MGLIKSVNDITYELQGQKTEKEKAKLQKLRKERIKNLLFDFFEIQFQSIQNKQTAYKKLLEQKDFAISEIKNAYFEKYETKLNDDNISYMNQNYFKILNSAKRQYFELEKIKQQEEKEKEKQQQEAEKEKEKQQEEAEKQKEKQDKNQTETLSIGSIIGGVTVLSVTIIFLPLLFCLFIISAALKSI